MSDERAHEEESEQEGTLEARTEWLEEEGAGADRQVFEAESVGRYVVVRELASGGMATVHLARYESALGLERIVALKRIHPHLAKQQRFIEMFFDEARLAARIDHPFVCRVYDFGRAQGAFFLAMEHLAGEPLSRLRSALKHSSSLMADPRRPWRVARIVADLAEGLHAAHELSRGGEEEGLVHRDVSPGNLYLLYDGTVRVADFGIARASHRLHRTETGTVKGTFAYSAPEQLRGERLDRRADVWSLGVVFWEMLTGQKLFRRGQPAETVRLVSTMPIAPPSSVRPGVPVCLDEIAMRALQRRPERRYGTAREMAEALEEAMASSSVSVSRGELAAWLRELVPGGAERVAEILRAASEPSEMERTRMAPQGASRGSSAELLPPRTVVEGGAGSMSPATVPGGRRAVSGAWWFVLLGAVSLGGAGAWLAWRPGTVRREETKVEASSSGHSASMRRPGLLVPSPPPSSPNVAEAAPRGQGSEGEVSEETSGEGTVHVTTEGDWALVRWRGRDLGRTPLHTTLPAGRHELELLPRGLPPGRSVRVRVRPGRQVVVGVSLGGGS